MANVRSVSGCDGADALLLGGPADLVLCEVRSDSADGVRLAYELADRLETTAVILVAEPGQEDLLIAALGSPAAGFFTKDSPVEDFLFGVQTVLTGHRAVSEAVMKRLTANLDLAQPVPDDPFAKLSPSEMQILRSVGEGETVANIAAGRGIATKTVRNHLASIYQKLEVRSRTEAILFVARAGASAGSRTKM